jgi:hypothetical protein
MPASRTVGNILGRGLSPFLDWMRRVHENIATRLYGG